MIKVALNELPLSAAELRYANRQVRSSLKGYGPRWEVERYSFWLEPTPSGLMAVNFTLVDEDGRGFIDGFVLWPDAVATA